MQYTQSINVNAESFEDALLKKIRAHKIYFFKFLYVMINVLRGTSLYGMLSL